ncbi:MAG: hypothetical protein R3A50_02915 [Saprospiraceae bacterium]|nr:hypothetical protein [Saprospiraceae bacterium]MCB9343861.1 ABC transporter ATPase [Lewinellaceae bacterium]
MSLPKLASLSTFAPESRLWVYVCDRTLTNAESGEIQEQLNWFCKQWTAHNQQLQAAAEVFKNQFVLLMVDETGAGASGCSIDKSVHFLEALGSQFNVDFFERMRFAWLDGESNYEFANVAELNEAVSQDKIADDSLMVNTLVQSKADLLEKWLVPFSKSWHRRITSAN